MQDTLLSKLQLIANSNEEGCNQYKPCEGGHAGTSIPDAKGGVGLQRGTKLKFHSGEHAGRVVEITGQHKYETKGQYAKYHDNPTYKGQIEGLKGGVGEVTIEHKTAQKFATVV